MESAYHSTCKKAFDFCIKYQRTAEFRRLCEMLRTHLSYIQQNESQNTQSANKAFNVTLESEETLKLQLETRFLQLRTSTELKNWQESFRTIQDIHNLTSMSERKPKPQMMAEYYKTLQQVFWISENYTFHACAYYRFFTLSRCYNKSLSEEEITNMASGVLLAAICTPVDARKSDETIFDFDTQKEKTLTLASLLDFSIIPDRKFLLDDLVQKNILYDASPDVVQLYHLFEKYMGPIDFSSKTLSILNRIKENESLAHYVPQLERLIVLRLLQQLSRVYSSIRIASFQALCGDISLSFAEIERLIVRNVKNGSIAVRIDHQAQCLHFGETMLEQDRMRSQLAALGSNLEKVTRLINPQRYEHSQEERAQVCTSALESVKEERNEVMKRKMLIEKRKEDLDKEVMLKFQEDEKKRKHDEELQQQKEKERLDKEEKKRQLEKQERIREEIQLAETKKILESMGMGLDQIDTVDRDKLLKEKKAQDEKRMKARAKKLRTEYKKLDHFIRALREV